MSIEVLSSEKIKAYVQEEVIDDDGERLHENERMVEEWDFVVKASKEADLQYYFAWDYFSHAKFVHVSVNNSFEARDEKEILYVSVRVVFPSADEVEFELVFGNEDYD